MLSIFKKIDSPETSLNELTIDEKNLLIASVLVECAKEDGEISSDEIVQIKKILSSKCKLDEENIKLVFDQAIDDSENRVELYSIIKKTREVFTNEEITDLFINMWEIILIDEIVDDYEASLMRRLVGLFHITDRESAEAKKIAMNKIKDQ
tara:strand:+ start:51 stop:503 length:453 start_codon:yes stop_codon:yes gene_type:complete